MKRTRPLFQFDAGWLFLAAGLAICVVVVLVPAQRDLFLLRQQRSELEAQERQVTQRLLAYAEFLGELNAPDADLARRLAATQFNVLPAGETPVLLVAHRDAAVTDWIDESVPPATVSKSGWPDTRLTQLATGSTRLWLLGAGVMSVFIGLLVGTETFTRVMRRQPESGSGAHESEVESVPDDSCDSPASAPAHAASAVAVATAPIDDAGVDAMLDEDESAGTTIEWVDEDSATEDLILDDDVDEESDDIDVLDEADDPAPSDEGDAWDDDEEESEQWEECEGAEEEWEEDDEPVDLEIVTTGQAPSATGTAPPDEPEHHDVPDAIPETLFEDRGNRHEF